MRQSCPFSAADYDKWRWELRQIVRSIAESVAWRRDLGPTFPALQACAFNHSATCPDPPPPAAPLSAISWVPTPHSLPTNTPCTPAFNYSATVPDV